MLKLMLMSTPFFTSQRGMLIRVLKLSLGHQLTPRPYLIFGNSLAACFSQRIPPVLIFKLQLTSDKLILS